MSSRVERDPDTYDQDVETIVAEDDAGKVVILAENTDAWIGSRDFVDVESFR